VNNFFNKVGNKETITILIQQIAIRKYGVKLYNCILFMIHYKLLHNTLNLANRNEIFYKL